MSTTATLPPASEVPAPARAVLLAAGPDTRDWARAVGDPTATVSVVIPARNEAANLDRCLAAVLAQGHPRELLEVVLVDGASSDDSVAIAERVLAGSGLGRWKILSNPAGDTPSNLNVGLAHATGAYLCRVDARSFLPSDYIGSCLAVLRERADVAVVGGSQVAEPAIGTTTGRALALALNNRYGMGGARYRSAGSSGPTDTVYLGFFRRDDLVAVGGWDERFATNQDFDLNRRLGERGMVWFLEGLPVTYRPRSAIRDLFTQYHRFGRWKVRYWRTTGDRPRPRQVVLLAVPPVAGLALGAGILVAWRWPWLVLPGLLGGAGLVVALDRGVPTEDHTQGERLLAVGILGVVATGWSTGIWREAVASVRSRRRRGRVSAA